MRFRKKGLIWVRCTLLLLVALIILLMAGVFVFRQQLGRYLLRRTVGALGRAIDGQVSYQQIEGDIFSHPRITGLSLITKSDSILINKLEVQYDLWALLSGKIVLRDVKVYQPDVGIARIKAPGPAREKNRLRFPELVVRRLQIVNAQIRFGGVERIDSLGLILNLAASGSRLELGIDSGCLWLEKEGIALRSISAKIVLENDSLLLKYLQARTGASVFEGSLTVDLRNGGMRVDNVQASVFLPELVKVPGRVYLSGSGLLTAEQKKINARWQAEKLTFQNLKLPQMKGEFKLTDSLISLNLSAGDVQLGRWGIQARLKLSDFLFSARMELESVPVNKIAPGLPEISLTATLFGSGRFGTLANLLKVPVERPLTDSVNITIEGRAKQLGVDTIYAAINYYEKKAQLRELVLAGPAGQIRIDGRAQRGRLQARCEMQRFDLSVAGRFLALPLTGRADGSLQIYSTSDSWEFYGLVRVSGFGLSDFSVSNGLLQADLAGSGDFQSAVKNPLSGRLAIGGEGVKIAGQEWNWAQFVYTGPEFDLQIERDSVQMMVAGEINFEKREIKTLIKRLNLIIALDTIRLLDSCRLTLKGDSVEIGDVRLNLADGEARFYGTWAPAVPPAIHLSAKGINLRKIQRIIGLKTDLSGTVDLNVLGRDSLNVHLAVSDLELSAASIYFKHLTGDIKLTRTKVALNYLKFVARTDTSTINGSIEYELKPAPKLIRMDLKLTLNDPGVWLFQVTRPYVEIQQGIIYAQAGVNWKPDSLVLSGRARVTNGELIVPSVQAKVEGFDAELTLKENRIVLEKLSGRTSKGLLTAEGFAQLDARWQCESLRYQTYFSGASAIPIPQVLALGNGDITVQWQKNELALISGEVKIEEALATIGFGSQTTTGRGSPNVNYDIHIRGERGIWLRNREADIELGVDLTIRQVGDELLYFGEMVCRQGAVYYLDHTMRVTQGKFFFDNTSGFNPQLDLTAELPVTGKRDNGPEKIILKLTGTLQNPSFLFQSEPQVWDETQIITYLSLNVTMDELTALEQKELVSRLLSARLLSYFQTQVAKRVREFISLDYLELETGLARAEEARVTVGKYIGRNLYFSYTQNFTQELVPAFRIEYYLNRRNELVVERTDDGRYSLRYRFKLRF
jgi:hypothetical protein